MDDNTILTFGKHKGKKLANVPASYLLWLYEQPNLDFKLRIYIKENMEGLQSEIDED